MRGIYGMGENIMKFSVLADILVKAKMVTDVTISEDCEIEDLNLMDRDYREFGDHIVYFIRSEDIGPGTALPKCLIYKNIFPEYRVGGLQNSARMTGNHSFAEVFRYVKLQLNNEPEGKIEYAELVSKLVAGVSLKTVCSDAQAYTGNLFAAIDLSGKVLEYSEPFYVDYPLWMESIRRGYCDEVLMDYIQFRRRDVHTPEGENGVSLYCKKTDMYILVSKIQHQYNNSTSETLGYFFALSKRPIFDKYTRKLLPLFAQKIKERILRLKTMDRMNDFRSIMRTNILLDAVDGASPTETVMRSKLVGIKFQRIMKVLVIRTPYSKDPDFYNQILMPTLSNEILGDRVCFPWRSSVVCLLNAEDKGLIMEKRESLLALARQYKLQIGVSNTFSDIARFSEHFEQARTALSFANRSQSEGPFFYYMDYTFYILLDRINDDIFMDSCCHPALEQLAAYDAKKGMDLLETLRVYTESGFSKAQAAQKLFIHRNTINYRIQQIEQLCDLNFSDEKLLFVLQMSFRLYFYRKNHLIPEG